jgi:DNA-binding LacI/PurR family transcriptional regulator
MASKITSLQVAERAGVSQSAVSRVFTPGASVSQKTADKVRQAARDLGYRPNVLARAMITGRSRMIGLVVAYLENHFYPEALEKLSKALQEQGYHVLIFLTSQTAGSIDHVVEEILDYQVDGIILASVAMSSDISARCEAAGVPVVLFNRAQPDDTFPAVVSDNFEGGLKIAQFLAAGTHQRISYIAGWEGAMTQLDREAGFRQGLDEAGIPLFSRTCGEFDTEKAKSAARDLFAGGIHPDAVFVANDHMSFAVMDVLRFELGLNIPGDVSVVGFDDVSIASWPSYDLTTVRQRANLMVEETVNMMLARIQSPALPCESVSVEAPLIIRGSARIPKGWTS